MSNKIGNIKISQTIITHLLVAVIIVSLQGCVTYYQKNALFQEQFVKGEMEAANKILDSSKKKVKEKDKLLFDWQKGIVEQMLERYTESNQYFENAYLFAEDYKKNYGIEALSLVTNPMIKPYIGEDHELVLVHYFKALNYLRLHQYEQALVECRRIDIRLNDINDKYKGKQHHYKKDAFAINLMGITYEASGDINNAFIAYRNAYNAYVQDYLPNYGTAVPEQLKRDLLRSAYLNGFTDELRQYEQLFSTTYQPTAKSDAELIFFWHNGMGPIKDEWSVNFAVVKGSNGAIVFANKELGLTFPFPSSSQGSGSIGDLKFVRIAFPKYLERRPYFNSALLKIDEQIFPLELGENINAIAFKGLQDRFWRELSNSIVRLALKQAAEQQLRKQNENLGALLSVLNAVSEKADTRNWQTLPYSISYARVPLKQGNNILELKTMASQSGHAETQKFEFDAKKGETKFHIFNSLNSAPLDQR